MHLTSAEVVLAIEDGTGWEARLIRRGVVSTCLDASRKGKKGHDDQNVEGGHSSHSEGLVGCPSCWMVRARMRAGSGIWLARLATRAVIPMRLKVPRIAARVRARSRRAYEPRKRRNATSAPDADVPVASWISAVPMTTPLGAKGGLLPVL